MSTSTSYLYRTPLLDPRQNVQAYKLGWQHAKDASVASTGENLRQFLSLEPGYCAKAPSRRFFLDTGPAALPAQWLNTLSPDNSVLMLKPADLMQPGNLSLAMSLHAQGVGLALCDADPALLESNDGLLCLMTHVEVCANHPFLAQLTRLASHAEPPVAVVVKNLPDWPALQACGTSGLSGFFENLCVAPRTLTSPAELGPQTTLILQLMQMVQANADVREVEKVLQRDATLSYKLFRYINSASFGLDVEIDSLRHAVTMLGYAPLYRWLALLLATTSTAGFSPALLQAAIVRGRFVELLGQRLLSRQEAGNLFVVGLFSLLDQLFGFSMEQVLRRVSLPSVMAQALLFRQGVYGPFLALAQSCEHKNGGAAELAEALFMTASQVNQAHLAALVWAQNLEI